MSKGKVIFVAIVVLFVVGFIFARMPKPEISLPAELVFSIAGLPFTNTLLAAWISIVVLVLLSKAGTSNMQMVPRGMQNLMEFAIEWLYGIVESVAGAQYARRFFPLVATIFFFVIANSWLSLIPGYGTIGIIHLEGHEGVPIQQVGPLAMIMPGAEKVEEGQHAPEGATLGVLIPILRGANTDLNFTLGMALVAMFSVEMWGIRAQGVFGYGSKFINVKQGPIYFFVGILEIISEISRIISFAFRLFGNMFGGEVLLGIIAFLIPWVFTVIFYGFELFVGLIQAVVFAGLTLVFTTMAVAGHGEEHHEASEAH